jgi:hypothetical protein
MLQIQANMLSVELKEKLTRLKLNRAIRNN